MQPKLTRTLSLPSYGYQLRRHVVIGGQDLGPATVSFYTSTNMGGLWVRPYFDPVTKELRLQGADGQDVGPPGHVADLVAPYPGGD